MFTILVNLKALHTLAQINLDLSVSSALRIVKITAAALTGTVLACATQIHTLRSPSPLLIGNHSIDRLILIVSALWIISGVTHYAKNRSWITDTTDQKARAADFSMRSLLGVDVLSTAFVERLLGVFFFLCQLIIMSVGVLVHASVAEIFVFLTASGIGVSLYAHSAQETMRYFASPAHARRPFPLVAMVTPLCLALIVMIISWGWKNTGEHFYMSFPLIAAISGLSSFLALLALARLIKTMKDMRGHPLGLPVQRDVRPFLTEKQRLVGPYTIMWMRVFVVRPVLSGIRATSWPLAVTLILTTLDLPQAEGKIRWLAAFTLIATLHAVTTIPDLLFNGRGVRVFYEEKGGFSRIFSFAFLTRTLLILPQAGVVMLLYHVCGGEEKEVFILTALTLVADLCATGIAGSSHQQASQYSIATSAFISFTMTLIGTLFLMVTHLAPLILSFAILSVAYLVWRNHVAYIA